jgi:hypothetical protein
VWDREADEARDREYGAAVTTQSWFRGCRLRAYLRYLSESAMVVQRWYRGHLGRKLYRQLLKDLVAKMEIDHYNAMAEKIQSRWRGYYVRKYVFDFYAQRRYLTELRRKNEIVGRRLEEARMQKEREETERQKTVEKLRMETELRRRHHMLSTECREGVYRPFREGRSQPLPIESRMRSLKFYSSTGKSKQRTLSCDSHVTGTSLPPVQLPNKIQGPFHHPGMVWRQRYKPPNPTLRVATPFNSEEIARAKLKASEWRERVVEEPFLPFSSPSTTYRPLLHTTSSYTRLAYGTEHFRDQATARNRQLKGFQTVVPPIPVFDKLNSTY